MDAALLGRPHAFERGDRVYLTTPLVLTSPSEGQIEEFAFASAIKSKAPNDNIGWLQGRYAEAERANLNGAMWLSEELALKSLTPMLMPVTVMHDPRTAVGTIADCKFFSEAGSTRLETVLGVWKHRFPDIWEEAASNLELGTLMQSMETFAPWYNCSQCETAFVKLPGGAERGSWCDCLRSNSGWRILRDTCFTGTGLIFGSRGGVGAYTEAYLDHFHDEIAEYHDRAHHDSGYRPNRSASQMGMVQIEDTELATLRQERNDARKRADDQAEQNRELTSKAEQAEAAQKKAEDERAEFEQQVTDLRGEQSRVELRDKRIGALGAGFLAKLGDTSKARLNELASACSEEDWDKELAEREELAGVKRDTAAAEGGTTTPVSSSNGEKPASTFENEEVARFMGSGVAAPAGSGQAPDAATSVRQLARSFGKKREPAGADK